MKKREYTNTQPFIDRYVFSALCIWMRNHSSLYMSKIWCRYKMWCPEISRASPFTAAVERGYFCVFVWLTMPLLFIYSKYSYSYLMMYYQKKEIAEWGTSFIQIQKRYQHRSHRFEFYQKLNHSFVSLYACAFVCVCVCKSNWFR